MLTPVIDTSKEYGLVLEGGGAKGAYQIGAWKALKEAGVTLDDLDAMYPIGDISEIKKYITEGEYKAILSKVFVNIQCIHHFVIEKNIG